MKRYVVEAYDPILDIETVISEHSEKEKAVESFNDRAEKGVAVWIVDTEYDGPLNSGPHIIKEANC